MQPSHSDLNRRRRDERFDARPQWSIDMPPLTRSASDSRRLRSEDSWIEISSQPSSSSLSSTGDQEIVTTGLEVQPNPTVRRPRQRCLHTVSATGLRIPARPSSAAGSSQDEYEESESESDRILSSSNEDLVSKDRPATSLPLNTYEGNDDEDDSSTTLGTQTSGNTIFTPQPNAFSHPPSSQTSQSASGTTPVPGSYFSLRPSAASTNSSTRIDSNQTVRQRNGRPFQPRLSQAQPSSTTPSHSPYNIIAPSHIHQRDHDAALRASLSTLLSCAAAVRGSPKHHDSSTRLNGHQQAQNVIEPSSLRLVPESHFLDGDEVSGQQSHPARRPRPPISISSASAPSSPKQAAAAKRKAHEPSKDRNAKKSRAATKPGLSADETTVSPTLMTWMISAGVVLIFSAISFSAGYAWGKEVGRFEGTTGIGTDSASCGQQAMRSGGGLRRLRWGSGSTSVRA